MRRRKPEQGQPPPQQPPTPPQQPPQPQEQQQAPAADWFYATLYASLEPSRVAEVLEMLTAHAELADPELRRKLMEMRAILSSPAASFVRTIAVFDAAPTAEAMARKAATVYLQLLLTAYSSLIEPVLDKLRSETDPINRLRLIERALDSYETLVTMSAVVESIARGIAYLSAPRPMGGWAGLAMLFKPLRRS